MARPTLHGDDVALGAVGALQDAYLFLMILPVLVLLVQAARFASGGETRRGSMPTDQASSPRPRDSS